MASPFKQRVLPPRAAHSRLSAMLMLAGLVAAQAPLPYTAVALVPLAWAAVESVLAIRERTAAEAKARTTAPATLQPAGQAAVRATARARTRIIVSSVVSLVLVSVLALMVLLPYAAYGTFKSRQDCMLGANTAIATADCNARFSSSLDSAFGGLLSSGKRAGG